ncbi:MAG: hypothetical protein MAG451_00922 [Anaerolineales bacterium]|nr:hypothetical protein [Anaerolineales bacterium]
MPCVTVKFLGHVRTRVGKPEAEFEFKGKTLRDCLDALIQEYDVRDLILTDEEDVRPYARVLVNGRFHVLVGGWDAKIEDGDQIALIHQFALAF